MTEPWTQYGLAGAVISALLGVIFWTLRDLRHARLQMVTLGNEHRHELMAVVERNTVAITQLKDAVAALLTRR